MSANVVVQATNFTHEPLVNRLVTFTPCFVSSINGLNVIVSDRRTAYTNASGIVGFSGVTSGRYEIEIHGPARTTHFNVAVTSGNVNAKDIIY